MSEDNGNRTTPEREAEMDPDERKLYDAIVASFENHYRGQVASVHTVMGNFAAAAAMLINGFKVHPMALVELLEYANAFEIEGTKVSKHGLN